MKPAYISRMASNKLQLDKKKFLQQYYFTEAEFEKTKLNWQTLEQICQLHNDDIPQLETTAGYISTRLRDVPAVHSLKVRIKHPEHLIAKIIRKRLENPKFVVIPDNYKQVVTDLIGIRALHLLKGDWRPIHEFVTATWELDEKPIAYTREGDLASVLAAFKECGCEVKSHPLGYRSVHYLLKSQPAKSLHLVELQVRTLFEEGWSEIDHQIRYPRLNDDPHLAEFIAVFNRLAGSADEMGTFVKALSAHLTDQTTKLEDAKSQLAMREKELKTAISDLKISKAEKQKLESQIDEFRKSSQVVPMSFFSSPTNVKLVGHIGPLDPFVASGSTIWSPGILIGGSNERTCSRCGKKFTDALNFVVNDRCPQCRNIFGG